MKNSEGFPRPEHSGAASAGYDEQAALTRLWELATLEVMHAQIAYWQIEDHAGDKGTVGAAGWLRLWQAQKRQRELAKQLDQLTDAS